MVRDVKAVSAKPDAVLEQAATDQVTKGQIATEEAAKPQTGTEKATKDQVAKGQAAKSKPPSRRLPPSRVAINRIRQRGSLLIGLLPRMRPPNSRRPTRTSHKSSLRSLRRCAHLNCI